MVTACRVSTLKPASTMKYLLEMGPISRVCPRLYKLHTQAGQSSVRHSRPLTTCRKHAAFNTAEQRRNYCATKPEMKFMNITTHGETFRVGYTDEGARDGPLVLALHGVPGTTYDFDNLFQSLLDNGNRIVSFNFPGYKVTQPGLNLTEGGYDETTEAKSAFILKCLEACDINRIDCLLLHSAASHTTVNLAGNTNLIRSIAFLSPVGIRCHAAIRPFWLTNMWAAFLENRFTRPIASVPLKLAYKIKGFSIDNLDLLLMGMSFASRINFMQVQENCKKVAAKGIPFVAAMSKKDKVMECEIGLDTVRMCGLPESNISYYDTNGNLVNGKPLDECVYPRALVFEGGGHFVHKKYGDQCNKAIVDLINSLE